MLFKYHPLKLFSVLLFAAMLTLNVHAAESGHEHHQHHEIQPIGEVDPHAHHKAMMKEEAKSAKTTDVELLDLMLTDQNGDDLKFVSDVIGDRIAVIDFIYTTCTTVCPVISAVFSQVQSKVGERLGEDVVLISVSVDPVRDTPTRLEAYAANHQAKPGWFWLTGNKRTMDRVLDGLGAYTPNFEDHPAMVLVGDGRTGNWSRFFGFPSPDRLMEQVNVLSAARSAATGG